MQIIRWLELNANAPSVPFPFKVEPFEKDIMDRPPRPGNEGVLPRLAAIVVLCQGLIQSMLTLGVYIFATDTSSWLIKPENAFLAPSHPSLLTKQSLAFATLTSMQLVQSFLSKSVSASFLTTGLGGNKWMIGAFLLSFSLLVAGFYIPGECLDGCW